MFEIFLIIHVSSQVCGTPKILELSGPQQFVLDPGPEVSNQKSNVSTTYPERNIPQTPNQQSQLMKEFLPFGGERGCLAKAPRVCWGSLTMFHVHLAKVFFN